MRKTAEAREDDDDAGHEGREQVRVEVALDGDAHLPSSSQVKSTQVKSTQVKLDGDAHLPIATQLNSSQLNSR